MAQDIADKFPPSQTDFLAFDNYGNFDDPPAESADQFRFCCFTSSAEEPGELEGKTIKELFPLIVKDIYVQEEKEGSLCPSFMKSGTISLSLSQNEIFNRDQGEKRDIKKEEVKVEEVREPIQLPAEEEPIAKKEGTETTLSREKRNRKFTQEEDERLKTLVKVYGEGAWSRIAEEMEGRNRKQVRERYVNFLKKERVVPEFTSEEDAIILQ
eukprot:TRINITY_DN2213_c0_g1_i15.p1 TRINITY_DN2213_c0_g1~~TRINITY_DN2213_c0_g1_i15.p1  ORF type:complete len:231 (-),score=77.48 TRINITY_DN2213_c0_g1_i15:432-1067(-)